MSRRMRFDSHLSCIDVTIACLDGFCDSSFLGMFILPGAEANGRDLGTGVELEFRRHYVMQ